MKPEKNKSRAAWLDQFIKPGQTVPSLSRVMKMLIRAALEGVTSKRGGPFVAAVVKGSNKVISVSYNKVGANRDSTAHAEILAIRQAQKKLKTTDLKMLKGSRLTLVTTCQPCVMCAGAIYWAGLTRVVAAARHEDARKGGIDPDLLKDASVLFRSKRIKYRRDLFRKAAAQVFVEDQRRQSA